MTAPSGTSSFASLARTLFIGLLICYLFGQGWYGNIIERKIFWGEGIAFLLIFGSLQITYLQEHQKRLIFGIFGWLFFVSAYAVVTSAFFWEEEVVYVHLLRHLAFFYYALFFFAGYKWGPAMLQMLARHWWIVLPAAVVITLLHGGSVGLPMTLGFLWLVCQKGNPGRGVFYAIWLAMIGWYGSLHNGTAKLIAQMLLVSPVLVYFMRLWNHTPYARWNKWFIRLALLAGVTALIFGANKLMGTVYQMAGAGGTLHDFQENFAFTDMNGVWRIMLWTYLFSRFLQYPFGIGLGTPLVGDELSDFMYLIQTDQDLYTSGAHNSFLTFIVRIGIPFLVFLVYMAFCFGKLAIRFLKETDYRVLDTPEKRFIFSSLLVFLIGVVQSFFNVVLESPIAAGLFWFNFGLCVRIVGDFTPSPLKTA